VDGLHLPGKHYRKPTKTGDKKLAQEILDEVKYKIRHGEWFEEEEDITFDKLVDLYQKEEDAKSYILQFIPVYLKYFGDRMLSQITRKDLYEFRKVLKQLKTKGW